MAAVLCAGSGLMHADFLGGGTKNSCINSKMTAMCLPAKPHPLILCLQACGLCDGVVLGLWCFCVHCAQKHLDSVWLEHEE